MTKFEKRLRKEWKNILFNIVFGGLSILIVILTYENILLTTALLIILSIIALIKWRSKITIFVFIAGAIWGPISEMIAIAFGVWQYSFTNIINIPLWLFILWGFAAAAIYQTAIEIKKLGVKDDKIHSKKR